MLNKTKFCGMIFYDEKIIIDEMEYSIEFEPHNVQVYDPITEKSVNL